MFLTTYIEKEQTKLFEELGVIFADSAKEFNRQKEAGMTYVRLDMGALCPKPQVKTFVERHSKIISEGIAKDLEENGKRKIILRELANHQCYYKEDYSDCVAALEDYGITEEEICEVYNGS